MSPRTTGQYSEKLPAWVKNFKIISGPIPTGQPMVMAMWRIGFFKDDGAWRLEAGIQIKGVLDEFNLGRADIREDNGHHIKAGSGFC